MCRICDSVLKRKADIYDDITRLFDEDIDAGFLGKLHVLGNLDATKDKGPVLYVTVLNDTGDNGKQIETPINFCPVCGQKLVIKP